MYLLFAPGYKRRYSEPPPVHYSNKVVETEWLAVSTLLPKTRDSV